MAYLRQNDWPKLLGCGPRFLLVLLCCFPLTKANASSLQFSVNIVDKCSQSPTRVLGFGNDSRLLLSAQGMEKESFVNVKVSMMPILQETPQESQKTNNPSSQEFKKILYHKRVHVRPGDLLEVGQSFSFDRRLLKSHPLLMFSTILVEWVDEKTGERGQNQSSLFIPADQKENIFLVQGVPLCHWQTPTQISGNYRYNEGPGMMVITHENRIEDISGIFKGFQDETNDMNATANWNGTIPILVYFLNFWTYSEATHNYGVFRQQWQLSPQQGGFFGTRMTFGRYPVQKIVYSDTSNSSSSTTSKCQGWKKVQKGFLDVGTSAQDFYVVPQSLQNDPLKGAQFADKVRPLLQTCKSSFDKGSSKYAIAESAGTMFYYPVSALPQK